MVWLSCQCANPSVTLQITLVFLWLTNVRMDPSVKFWISEDLPSYYSRTLDSYMLELGSQRYSSTKYLHASAIDFNEAEVYIHTCLQSPWLLIAWLPDSGSFTAGITSRLWWKRALPVVQEGAELSQSVLICSWPPMWKSVHVWPSCANWFWTESIYYRAEFLQHKGSLLPIHLYLGEKLMPWVQSFQGSLLCSPVSMSWNRVWPARALDFQGICFHQWAIMVPSTGKRRGKNPVHITQE